MARKLFDWCRCRHPRLARALQIAYAVVLVACIFGGGFAAGSLVAWSNAGQALSQTRADYRQALDTLARAVDRAAGQTAAAAGKAEKAADQAADAIEAAKGATATAGSAAAKAGAAATSAKAAASSASSVVRKVEKALAPPADPPQDAPRWLDGP